MLDDEAIVLKGYKSEEEWSDAKWDKDVAKDAAESRKLQRSGNDGA